jgi:hypothetical protein
MSNLTQSVEYKNDENINEINNTLEKQNEKQVVTKTSYIGIIWGIFNTCIWFVAIYLSFKCNEPFKIGSFLIACCCPHIYLIFILAKYGKCDALVKQFAEEAAKAKAVAVTTN